MPADERSGELTIREALRRQREVPDDHDMSLIEECLKLTPEQRLQRLARWVAFVASARRGGRPVPGGSR